MNFFFLIYFISIFNVFFLTPISVYTDIFVNVLSILGFIYFFKYKLIKIPIIKLSFYIIAVLIISSIISSTFFIKQDIFSSIIAIQHLFKGYSIIFIFKLIHDNKINLKKVFFYLTTSIWICTILLTLASLTKFKFTFVSPISGQELIITANKYAKDLLYFGELFFLSKFFFTNKPINLVYVIIILISTQLYDIQRGDLIFFSLVFVISLFLFKKRIASFKLYFLLPIIAVIGFFFLNKSDSSGKINEKFSQLFLAFNEENRGKIDDSSISVRLREIEFALIGFTKHPISGNGLIRSSKQKELIGDIYFYPVDIGLYGVLYSFGVLGIVIFLVLIYKFIKIKFSNLNYVSAGIYLFLMYSIFYSLKDGSVIFRPTQFLFCYLLIFLIENKINKIDA